MINPNIPWMLICSLITAIGVQAQAPALTLEESHALATQNYPMVKQRDLIARSASYAINLHQLHALPQINISGQATYQSAVTEIPLHLPGMDVPTLNKDQYKFYGEVNQNLYDGGITRLNKQAADADAEVKQQALDVELHKIKERVNQLYFGILLLDAQLDQASLLQQDIQAGLKKTSTAILNGAALKSDGSLLEAEWLNVQQQVTELRATRKAFLRMLGSFIGRPLDEHTVLEKPAHRRGAQTIVRPELDWYAQQKIGVDVARKLLRAKNHPKLGLFLQAGVGRPALNMLSNDFEAYYYGGVRLAIPATGFYTLKKEKAQLDVQEAAIDVQRQTFLFNTNLLLQQQQTEAAKYEELLRTDDRIIALRVSVRVAALTQLENGVITSADYVRETHAVSRARLAKTHHELQLLKAQYDIRHTTGN